MHSEEDESAYDTLVHHEFFQPGKSTARCDASAPLADKRGDPAPVQEVERTGAGEIEEREEDTLVDHEFFKTTDS